MVQNKRRLSIAKRIMKKAPGSSKLFGRGETLTAAGAPATVLPELYSPKEHNGKYSLELFAGCGALSKSLAGHGFIAAVSDIRADGCDLSDKRTMTLFKRFYGEQLSYVHAAPPCNTFSTANWPQLRRAKREHPVPSPLPGLSKQIRACLQLADDIASNTVELLMHWAGKGALVSIENPEHSSLWRLPVVSTFMQGTDKFMSMEVDCDQCAYGTAYKKSTKIVFLWARWRKLNTEHLQRMCRRCTQDHEHEALTLWTSKGRRTKGTAAYPSRLTTAWAKAISSTVG